MRGPSAEQMRALAETAAVVGGADFAVQFPILWNQVAGRRMTRGDAGRLLMIWADLRRRGGYTREEVERAVMVVADYGVWKMQATIGYPHLD